MLALLRRSRALALVLVLLAPGVSGGAVQLLHACPTATQRGTEHQHHGTGQSGSGQLPHCKCIGPCQTGAVLATARPSTVFALLTGPQHDTPSSHVEFVAVGNPSDLLPPATAPPLF